MSLGDLFIPFNHKPSLTSQPSSYTCPAGKYARVTITLETTAIADNGSGSANSSVASFWVIETDAVTLSLDALATTAGIEKVAGLINATRVIGSSSQCTNTAGKTGTNSKYMYVEEFDVLT